jgi:outer membrane protein with beta-barrel domain
METKNALASLLCGALTLAALPRTAAAQAARPLEISAAYVYARDTTIDIGFPLGWSVGVSKGVSGWLSIAGVYDDSRRTISTVAGDLALNVRAAMAGGKASARLGRATEFGHVLAGLVHASGHAFGFSEASTHASLQAGAGVDFPMTRKLALRGELDYRLFLTSSDILGRQLRVVTGVVFTGF